MSSATTVPTPAALQPADPQAYYQALFDSLGDAYWAASSVEAKDQIQGLRDAAYEILTALTQAKLDNDTTELIALGGLVAKTNDGLEKLQEQIDQVVAKIQVVADVEHDIAQVLSLAGKLI